MDGVVDGGGSQAKGVEAIHPNREGLIDGLGKDLKEESDVGGILGWGCSK